MSRSPYPATLEPPTVGEATRNRTRLYSCSPEYLIRRHDADLERTGRDALATRAEGTSLTGRMGAIPRVQPFGLSP